MGLLNSDDIGAKIHAMSRTQALKNEIARLERLNAEQAKTIEFLMDARDEDTRIGAHGWIGLALFALLVLSFGGWAWMEIARFTQ